MAVTKLPPVVLAAVLSACATEPVLLNSERIQKKFGSYGIDVLASEAGLRRSSLYSLDDGQHICRTYAVVRFADQLDERYGEEHAEVLRGNSIGATFRAHGWKLHKQTLYLGELPLPAAPNTIGDLMQIDGGQALALHIYQLLLVREDQVFDYAVIIESHHPDYLAFSDLQRLYEYDTTNALSEGEAESLIALVLRTDSPPRD